MSDNDNKKFPSSSEGVRDMFKMDKGSVESQFVESTSDSNIPENLPFEEGNFEQHENSPESKEAAKVEGSKNLNEVLNGTDKPIDSDKNTDSSSDQSLDQLIEENDGSGWSANPIYKTVKTILPYLVIFLLALGLYAFYFSDFSVNSIFDNNKLKLESILSGDDRDKNLAKLKEENKADYLSWVAQFFVDVNDEAIIDMDSDVSGNGLTNFEKYLLNLNPKVYSTRGNLGDGQAVIEDINPWTGKKFTDSQKELVDKFINRELISNRITAAALTRGITKFAQYVAEDSPYYMDSQQISDLALTDTYITAPNSGGVNATSSNGSNPGSVVGAIPQPNSAINLNDGDKIDQSKPGRLDIPANNISVPLVWTQDVRDFDTDLRKGIVHYPGTAFPGEVGTSYISGHSSGYLWDKNPYREVFEKLGQVKDGTSFTITATQLNGKQVKFNYVVQRRGEFAANDQAQFVSTAESIVALSTCWPVGTTDRRLVLFSKLTQIERS